jgi:hypothetical protein
MIQTKEVAFIKAVRGMLPNDEIESPVNLQQPRLGAAGKKVVSSDVDNRRETSPAGLTRQQKRALERHPPPELPESKTRRALRMLVQSWDYLASVIKAVIFWIWRLITVNNAFRFLTLMSVGYLVYDRVFETDASVSVQASDPNDAFEFPFSINNNSHLFSISNIHWNVVMIQH